MAIGDPALALEKVKEFLDLLDEDEAALAAGKQPLMHEQRILLQPLIEKIAREVDPDSAGRLAETWNARSRRWDLNRAIKATVRLIGFLHNRGHEEQIFGPVGPTLAAGQLHPWVWDAVANLWDDGHYEPAVHEAAKAVELQTQLKIDRRDIDGKVLYAQAFSTNDPKKGEPRLRFSHIDRAERPRPWTSAHEGAMYLGMGCAQGIRNPQAHPSDDITEQEALEQLAALSVLARWVDACELDRVE